MSDTERTALTEDAETERVGRLIQQFEGHPDFWRDYRDAANAILLDGYSRHDEQGEPSDAQVEAALGAYWGPGHGWSQGQLKKMRAALRAAGSVQ